MNDLFYVCVEIIKSIAQFFGISYEEANIWIFVIIHPLLTVIFFIGFVIYWRKYKNTLKYMK